MYALLHRALAVAVVLVAATFPSLAQGVGLVSGRVTDERGVPLKDVVVRLSSPGTIGTLEALTDEEGRYRFLAVTGSHPLTIRAEAAGRVPVQYIGHKVRRDGTIAVDFRLRAPGDHEILVLLQDGVPYHEVALEGALSTMPGHATALMVQDLGPETVRALRDRLQTRPSAVLAIGELAARLARRHIQDVPVVHSMVPAPLDSDLTTKNICGVPLNGGFEDQIQHLRHLLPEARHIGTVYNPRRMGRCLKQLKDAAAAGGIAVTAAHMYGDDEADLRSALDELRDHEIDAFMLLLDPRVMDAGSFEQVVRFAQSRDLVLAVPDPSLVVPGKTFSFSPGFWELGAYAGTLVRRIVEGKLEPSQIGMSYPSGIERERIASRGPKQTPQEMLPADSASRGVQLVRDE